MPMRTRDLIRSYVSDLDVGDLFSVDDVVDWFKSRWPRYTPSGSSIGSSIRSFDNVQIVSSGIYKVIA